MTALRINLLLAWVWICLGFLSGLGLGLFFQRENWLGGYSSLKRRLYRLCHISFFGLGVLNLCFFLTAQAFGLTGTGLLIASWAFIVGAVTMPLCCLVMAHFPRVLPIFSVPVVSLLLGGALTIVDLAHVSPRVQTGTTSFPARARSHLEAPKAENLFVSRSGALGCLDLASKKA